MSSMALHNCGQLKPSAEKEGCTSDVMRAIKESVVNGKITCELKAMF